MGPARDRAARRAALAQARLIVIAGGGRREPAVVAREALAAGARFIQLRVKGGAKRAVYEVALALAEACAALGALLVVNDDADVALSAGADGVHVGAEDLPPEAARRVVGPDRLVGASLHDAVEAARAARSGAVDYAGVGTIYGSPTKPGLPARGPETIGIVRAALGGAAIPLYAIGGITPERVPDVLAAGAHGVAVGSAIADADDIARATASFLAALRGSS